MKKLLALLLLSPLVVSEELIKCNCSYAGPNDRICTWLESIDYELKFLVNKSESKIKVRDSWIEYQEKETQIIFSSSDSILDANESTASLFQDSYTLNKFDLSLKINIYKENESSIQSEWMCKKYKEKF